MCKTISGSTDKGFTLIEILVTVFIIGLLASVATATLTSSSEDTKQKLVHADFNAISTALKVYHLDNSRYPTAEQGLGALIAKPDTYPVPRNWRLGGYMERIPLDPWGQEYFYQPGNASQPFELISYGADQRPGGEGADQDISNLSRAR